MKRFVFFFFALAVNIQRPGCLKTGDPIDPAGYLIHDRGFKVLNPTISGDAAFGHFFAVTDRGLHHARMSQGCNGIGLFVTHDVMYREDLVRILVIDFDLSCYFILVH